LSASIACRADASMADDVTDAAGDPAAAADDRLSS
jgi:hypothetical protein